MKKVSKIMIVVLALACIVGAVFAFAACRLQEHRGEIL